MVYITVTCSTNFVQKRRDKEYKYVRTYNMTRTKVNGLILKHRLIYEEYYKCCLLPWIHLHHINGDKKDNRIENLQPLTASQHMKIHNPRIWSDDSICSVCGTNKTYFDKQRNKPMWFRDDKDGVLCGHCHRKTRNLIKQLIRLSFPAHSLY